jgi:hypothetical protein
MVHQLRAGNHFFFAEKKIGGMGGFESAKNLLKEIISRKDFSEHWKNDLRVFSLYRRRKKVGEKVQYLYWNLAIISSGKFFFYRYTGW